MLLGSNERDSKIYLHINLSRKHETNKITQKELSDTLIYPAQLQPIPPGVSTNQHHLDVRVSTKSRFPRVISTEGELTILSILRTMWRMTLF